MYCKNCGKELNGKFCSNCGTPANFENSSSSKNKRKTVIIVVSVIMVIFIIVFSAIWKLTEGNRAINRAMDNFAKDAETMTHWNDAVENANNLFD